MLDAAMAIILEEGIEALTIAKIARRLDAAVGALYRNFPGKDELLFQLQQNALHMLETSLSAQLDAIDDEGPAKDRDVDDPGRAPFRLCAALHAYLEDAIREPERHALVDAFMSVPGPRLSDDDARQTAARLEGILGRYGALLDDAVRTGALGPGDSGQRT